MMEVEEEEVSQEGKLAVGETGVGGGAEGMSVEEEGAWEIVRGGFWEVVGWEVEVEEESEDSSSSSPSSSPAAASSSSQESATGAWALDLPSLPSLEPLFDMLRDGGFMERLESLASMLALMEGVLEKV